MRAFGCLKLGAGVLVTTVALGAGLSIWQRGTMRPATWVVAETHDGQRTLRVEWGTPFEPCAQRPVVEVDERDTEIRLRARYRLTRGVQCGLAPRRYYARAFVHLDRPLAGR